MTIPKSPPNRYSASRQLIAGSDINNLSDASFSFAQITAIGVDQGSAAPIDSSNVEVLSGSANNAGVRLPVSYPGASVSILNNSLNTTNVYASGTDVLQNGGTTYAAAAAAVSMATLVSVTWTCFKTGFWQRGITG
jgi:hypothetical protein